MTYLFIDKVRMIEYNNKQIKDMAYNEGGLKPKSYGLFQLGNLLSRSYLGGIWL